MIQLCGFAVSNYYNKVKLALLEKGIPFEEVFVMTGSKDDAVLCDSPLAKVPFLRTPQGPLCESEVIMGYLEAAFPGTPPLLPADPYAAAKVRELSTFIDLHLELVARDLYAQAFFGGSVSEDTKASVRKRLNKNIPAFQRHRTAPPILSHIKKNTSTQDIPVLFDHIDIFIPQAGAVKVPGFWGNIKGLSQHSLQRGPLGRLEGADVHGSLGKQPQGGVAERLLTLPSPRCRLAE